MRVSRETEAAMVAAGAVVTPKPTTPAITPSIPKARRPASSRTRSKFHNCPTDIGGVKFDSRKEAARWCELLAHERAGRIAGLRRQVRFPLSVNGLLVCTYVADFVYLESGRRVVEDVKSAFTRRLPVYRLKAKLMRAVWGITIREV